MKKRFVRIIPLGLLAAGLALASSGCNLSPVGDPMGRLTARTGCKSVSAQGAQSAEPFQIENRECVEYDYDGKSVLRLRHINAGFNCCPGEITATFLLTNGEIRIKEKESSSLCDCHCLYDIAYEFVNVRPGLTRITIVGPYQPEEDPPLEFLADLGGATSGTFCVERTRYPWSY